MAEKLNRDSYKDVFGHLWDVDAEVLQEIMSNRMVLEIGTHHGKSAIAIAATAHSVETIDWGLGDPQLGQFDVGIIQRNLETTGAADKVTSHIGDWEILIETRLKLNYFDAVFYDAGHLPPDAYEKQFLEAVERQQFRGLVAIHDYKPWDHEMRFLVEAVDDYERRSGRKRQGPLNKSSVCWFEPF